MIKRVPYSSDLIPVGNAQFYEGQTVYSDGRVAYGWLFPPERPAQATAPSVEGLWVYSIRGNTLYRLINHELTFGRWIKGPNFYKYDGYCLPCRFTYLLERVVYTEDSSYQYTGSIFYIDGSGAAMTYDGSNVRMYDSDGTVVATVAVPSLNYFKRFATNCTRIGNNLYKTTDIANKVSVFDGTPMFELADKDVAYVFHSVAYVAVENVITAEPTGVTVTLSNVSSVTLSSQTVEFYSSGTWSNSITLTASGSVRVRATVSGEITVTYDYDGTTVTDVIQLLVESVTRISTGEVHTVREFVIDENGMRPALYPEELALLPDVKIKLFSNNNPDCSLVITKDDVEYTVGGDPFGLLTGNRPADIHACSVKEGIYIANKARLWLYTYNNNAYTEAHKDLSGLQYCWNLVWLKKRIMF